MIAALGISAAAELYKSLTSSASSKATDSNFQSSTTSATDPTAAGSTSATTKAGVGGVAKLSADINALLLSLQAANGSGASPTATSASASTTASTTGASTTGGSTTGAAGSATTTDPNAAIQTELQNLSGDLQKAGGAKHHHHHHGSGGGGAPPSSATDAATASSGTGQTATPTSTSNGLYGQLSQALNAYASRSASVGSSVSTLLTA